MDISIHLRCRHFSRRQAAASLGAGVCCRSHRNVCLISLRKRFNHDSANILPLNNPADIAAEHFADDHGHIVVPEKRKGRGIHHPEAPFQDFVIIQAPKFVGIGILDRILVVNAINLGRLDDDIAAVVSVVK